MYIPSVYQSEEYKRALEAGGKNLIHISDQLFAIEREIKLPVLGVQKILEARGFPSREELKKFWVSQGLGVSQVRAVVDAFVAKVWGEVIADGIVTSDEKGRLRAVVYGLKLPVDILPAPIRDALA